MLNQWKEGPGERTCIVVKFLKKELSQKWVLIKVIDDHEDLVCYQASTVWSTWHDRGFNPMEMCALPYLSRPVFATEQEAEKFIKKIITREHNEAKEEN